ncbi:MAG: 4-hydroxy-tetrahydrodipicolinate synthase, partial [Pseudomonadota bacterium]|nr:4-hydroxy-tetrahydrodipicolinate synthase [Pseudomonadota bacterium]MEC8535433.1 4-hydroxy-tetrahydrodipicolinate synthase [Pseudomonadota bacterium]
VKFAAAELGLCSEELRLPLVPVTEPTKKAVLQALIHAGLA